MDGTEGNSEAAGSSAVSGWLTADLMRHLRVLTGCEAMLMALHDPLTVQGLLRLVESHSKAAGDAARTLLDPRASGFYAPRSDRRDS